MINLNVKVLAILMTVVMAGFFFVPVYAHTIIAPDDFLITNQVGVGMTSIGASTQMSVKGSGFDIFNLFDNSNNEIFTILNSGNVGVGVEEPTAFLHLGAGTTTNPPLKLTLGTALTTPELGALEFINHRFYITNKSVRKAIDRTADVKLTTTTLVNTAIETTVFTAEVPANSWVAGNVLKMVMAGNITNVSSSQDVTIRVKVGGTEIAKVVSAGGNLEDNCWHVNGQAIIRSVGESGEVAWHMDMVIDEEADSSTCEVGDYNTLGDLDITVTAEWDSANEGNIFNCTIGFMEYKN